MMSAPMISFSLAACLATTSPLAIATSLQPINQIADAAENVNAQGWPTLVTSDTSCQGKAKRKKRTKAKSNTEAEATQSVNEREEDANEEQLTEPSERSVVESDRRSADSEVGGDKAASAHRPPRMPRYYGLLELTESQRSAVIEILAKRNPELKALQAQLNELRQKRDTELAKLLTKTQRSRLQKLSDKRPN